MAVHLKSRIITNKLRKSAVKLEGFVSERDLGITLGNS